jgi:hypothetical protein
MVLAMLLIRDVYPGFEFFNQESEFFHPGSEFFHPRSRVKKARVPYPEQKNLSIFNPTKFS